MHWDYVAILLVLAVIVPWRSHARVIALLQSKSIEAGERVSLYASTIAFQWAISLVIIWRCRAHGLGFADLGLTLPHAARGLTVAVAISAVLALNQVFGVLRLAHLPVDKRGVVGQIAQRLLPRVRIEKWAAVALVLTVSICEEFIYRGFIQSLFQYTLHSVTAGILISAVFFAAAHAYQGKRGLITTFAVGLIFSIVRVWTGSLVPSMIIHFAVDFSAGMAASRLLRSAGRIE